MEFLNVMKTCTSAAFAILILLVSSPARLSGDEISASRFITENPTTQKADRPNIILCMTDDQGWQDVGFNGHPFLKTPNLDRMASSGLKFNRWYAAAPVCSPTRGSCLTGRHPFRYGIYFANRGHLKAKEICLAELLQEQGYATGHFGKWHLGTLTTKVHDANRGKPGNTKNFAPPWQNGFETCFSTESKVPTFDPMKNPAAESKAVKKGQPLGGPYGTSYWTGEDKRVPNESLAGDDSMLIVEQAVKFMQQANEDGKPFFAVVWFHAPHLPVVAGERHLKMYADHPFGLFGQHYAGCLSAVDDAMGVLQAELESANVASNTMLWFSSDNGPEGSAKNSPGSAQPFRGRKRDLYEGGVRVPGFVCWPKKITSSRTTEAPCVTSDYFPTILDMLDIPLPNRPYDGVSLLPLLKNEVETLDRGIGFQSKKTATWVTDRYKLICKSKRDLTDKKGSGDKTYELYDLLVDPAESNDLLDQKPAVAKELKALLIEWQSSCKKSDEGGDY